jgi:tripartite-type tricarboxylate transporter receptor subunit TctC
MSRWWKWSGLAAVAIMLAPAAARADNVADFYKGKTINIIVGFGPGGGYDAYARLLARYYGKHIPGHPSIVVQNMTGGGSVRAANHVYAVAPKDGTVIAAVNQNMPMYQLLGGEGARFDSARIQWLGSMAHSNGTLYTWHDTNVRTLDEAKTRSLPLGGTGTTSDSHIFPNVINTLLGTKFDVVNGYPDGNAIDLALERGEVKGRGGNSWASVTTNKKQWVDEKKINILVQIGFKPEPDLPNVPLLVDLVKDPDEKQIVSVISLPTVIGFAHWVAPEVPKERVAALRAAYAETLKDPDFLAEAKKMGQLIRPQSGEEVEALVQKAASTTKPVLERTAKLLGWGK